MSSILFRMPAGIPGDVTRREHLLAEPMLLLPGSLPSAYGQPLVVDASTGKFRAVIASDTSANIAGLLIRSYPQSTVGTAYDALGASVVNGMRAGDIMRRGYMTVLLGGAAAAAKGAPAFIRIANPSQGKPLGGIEAASDGANTIQFPFNTYFMGPADSQGNTELAFNI